MKRIEKAKKEVAFIEGATSKDLIARIEKGPFSASGEIALVKQGGEPLELYIEEYGLQIPAAIELFSSENVELSEKLLAWNLAKPEITRAFLDFAPYEVVKKHLDYFQIQEFKEYGLLMRFDHDELVRLLKKGQLSLFAKCFILVSEKDDDLVKMILKQGGLNPREKKAALEHASLENLEMWYETEQDIVTKMLVLQFKVMRFSFSEIRVYFEDTPLLNEAEKYFFNHAPIPLLLEYVLKHHPSGGDIAVIKRCDDTKMLKLFFTENLLSARGERFLVCEGEPKKCKLYMTIRSISPDNEVHLVHKGNHKDILFYLGLHSLSKEGQLAVIERGNPEEIERMLLYPLANDAFIAICKNEELRDMFEERIRETAVSIV